MKNKVLEDKSVVRAKVVRILPYLGVLVRLQNGARGIIRRRELSWAEKEPDPSKYVSVGDYVEAVVLSSDPETGNLALSLRLRAHDPWEGVEKRYSVGDEIEGRVTAILPDRGAFVEVEPGVEGFLPISQIHPERQIKNVEEVLWVEDSISALVTRVDPAKRHIHLSLKAYLENLRRQRFVGDGESAHETPLEDMVGEEVRYKLYQLTEEDDDGHTYVPAPERVQRVLIIDDNPNFGEPLRVWLQQKGYRVELATTGNDGLTLAGESDHDLIFVDAHLPDVPGARVAEQISDQHPEAATLIVSGDVEGCDFEAAMGCGVPVWLKPLSEDDLIAILVSLEANGGLPAPLLFETPKEPDFLEQGYAWKRERRSLALTIKDILRDLRKETGAEAVALFRVEEARQEVRLLESMATPAFTDENRHFLFYSPVRDVTLTRTPVVANTVSERRFRYLLKWIDFSACIGVPVPAQLPTGGYSVFVFYSSLKRSSKDHVLLVRAAASQLAAVLVTEEGDARLRQAQQFILQGKVAAGLLHELQNRLGGADLTSNTILGVLQNPEPSGMVEAPSIAAELHRLKDNLDQMKGSVQLFRRLSREEVWEKLDVNHALHQNVEMMKHRAAKNKVELSIDTDLNLPSTRTIPVRLDQVVLNVILNAIEWTREWPNARIIISSQHDEDDRRLPIKIRFQDNGPGIHRNLFSRIWDLGFTTKEGGTGLGLYIARGLMDSIGGRISVERSTILMGSTFLVELPLVSG